MPEPARDSQHTQGITAARHTCGISRRRPQGFSVAGLWPLHAASRSGPHRQGSSTLTSQGTQCSALCRSAMSPVHREITGNPESVGRARAGCCCRGLFQSTAPHFSTDRRSVFTRMSAGRSPHAAHFASDEAPHVAWRNGTETHSKVMSSVPFIVCGRGAIRSSATLRTCRSCETSDSGVPATDLPERRRVF